MIIRHVALRILVAASAAMFSLNGMEAPNLQQKLQSEYPLTTPTADNTAIVTAGCVVTFTKRGLTASAVTSGSPAVNSYKNKEPQIHPSTMTSLRKSRFGIPGIPVPGSDSSNTRVFVNGEKMFVTKVDVDLSRDTITFGLISDTYSDIRYHALLRFEFPKESLATAAPAQVQAVLDQAFTVAPPDSGAAAPPAAAPPAPAPGASPAGTTPYGPAAGAPAPVSQAEPALAPIAPPPPPPPDAAPPKSIAIGQTPDQVVSVLGQPQKIVKLGTKEVYYYKDMKVTFVSGKMTDAQ
jgi:hypothetical protein